MNARELFNRRKRRVRAAIRNKAGSRLRLTVFRSGKNIYAQIIDDAKRHTLVSASSMEKTFEGKNGGNKVAAEWVGKLIAERAKSAGITEVVFDRGGYIFHGRVKSLADAARAVGLSF